MNHRFKSYQLSNNIQYRLQIQPHDIYSHVIMVPYIQPLTNVSLIFTCAVRNNSGSLNYDRRKVHGTVFQYPTFPKKKLVNISMSWLRYLQVMSCYCIENSHLLYTTELKAHLE